MIGDRESDVEAGIAAGVRAIRLGPEGTQTVARQVYPDLSSAVADVIGSTPERSEVRTKKRTAAGGSAEPTVPSFGEVNSRPYLIRMTQPWVN